MIEDFKLTVEIFPELTPLETLNMVLVKDEREALIKALTTPLKEEPK